MNRAIETASAVWGNDPRKAISPSLPSPRYSINPRFRREWKIIPSVSIEIRIESTIMPAGPRASKMTWALGLIFTFSDLIFDITELVMLCGLSLYLLIVRLC